MFGELLLNRQNILSSTIEEPENFNNCNDDLRQWLRVVGLSQQTINSVIQHVDTLEALLQMHDDDICAILTSATTTSNQPNNSTLSDEPRRLVCAIKSLRRYQQCLKGGTEPDMYLWDSWERPNNHIRLGTSPKITSGNRKNF
jgi:kinase suppressor of Ras 2